MPLKSYAERKTLRALETSWTRMEGFVNRLTKSDFNPLYHLGTLTIFMLIVLIATGAYLTLIYRPGADVAYSSIEKISSNGFGSLVRSVHRYASDAIILLALLHLIKNLISDRFWGQRWLAWTSGWVMLAMIWLVGTFGYWLVWDERAQWMTEYMMRTIGGSPGLTYVGDDIVDKTFINFVIILFLHVFLPLVGFLGIYIHGLRLSRARWWSPRWVSIQALVGLVVLSLIRPAMSFAPADLSTIVKSVPLDSLYLGLLPLTEMWGNVIFWGLAMLIFGSLIVLPWLAPGRDDGPAIVIDDKCTGCVLCYAECPYDAILMVPRQDESGYQKLAVINVRQCTACGVCVGACPADAIALKGGYTGEQIFGAVRGALHREVQNGHPVTVVFTSERALALMGLPAQLNVHGAQAQVAMACWSETDTARVVTVVLPSVGAVNIEWIKSLQNEGARDIVIASHPYDDGLNREDAHWILNRLHLRPALVTDKVHWLDAAPTDAKILTRFLDDLHRQRRMGQKSIPKLPPVKGRNKLVPSLVSAFVGTVLLLGFFALALPLEIPAGMAAEDSALRIAIDAKGKVELSNVPEGIVLPPGADPETIFGGEHFPISLRVLANGAVLLDQTYRPSGISRNGRISVLEIIEIQPGLHQVEVLMKDDLESYRTVYSGKVDFEKGKVQVLMYDEPKDVFVLK